MTTTRPQSPVAAGAALSAQGTQTPSAMKRRRLLHAYLFMFPAFLVISIFVFIPLAQVIYYSFTDFNMLNDPQWVGLANYTKLFNDGVFWQSLVASFTYLLVTPILIVASIGLAIVVNRNLPGVYLFRALYYIPVVISAVAIGMIFDFVYKDQGLINGALRSLRIIDQPIGFMLTPALVLPSIMAVTIWRGLGYYMVMFLAGLQSIPEELYEAAAIDGANRWQQHIFITVPMLRPVITFVAIISSISALRAFDEIYILTNGTGGVLDSALTTMFYLYRQAFRFNNIGYAAAIAVVFTVLTMALSLLNLRFLEGKEDNS